jgi:SAM-dependent methyltransferase
MTRLLAIGLISAAILAYEVLLVRLFAIVQWHHFAYMVISIALLGFGISGTVLALFQERLKRSFDEVFAICSGLFAVTSLAAFALSQQLPFNALEVLWDTRQLVYLLALYGLFTVPFFIGATGIGLAFLSFGAEIGRIYRANLIGSGLGALAMVAALFWVMPGDGLRLVMALGLAAGALALAATPKRRWGIVIAVAALAVPISLPRAWVALKLSDYKGLSLALQVPDARLVDQVSSPLGLISVVSSPTIPLRHAPGLSLAASTEPPAQLGIFTDGNGPSVITAFDGGLEPLAYLDESTSAAPYHLLERPEVLVLGAGGGADVLQGVAQGAKAIDAVELDGQVIALVRDRHRDFAGDLYRRPEVRLHRAEVRAFMAGSPGRWDLIQIPLLDSLGAAAAGVHSLSESYLYTVEAFRAYLRHLRPGGFIAVTRWLKLPPRDSLKLFATARVALAAEGAVQAESQLALLRGWNTTTLLVKQGPFTGADLAALGRFAEARFFDLAYAPGLDRAEANRFNLLDQPYFHDGAAALAGPGRDGFIGRYKFDIRPTRDDRPYFSDFFRWRSLPEILDLRARGGVALLEWGYPILFATLAQAAVLSALLILLPLRFLPRGGEAKAARWRILIYFTALGLAFLFIEIAFIQRFTLFLGHPLSAVAVVLAAFLIFAGAGSGIAPRLEVRRARARAGAIDLAAIAIAGVAVIYLWALPALFAPLVAWPQPAKVAVSLVLIAPLAFAMGLPFPLGLARVSRSRPRLVPWAWGVNGCASVISAVLATVLAIHFGFTVVVLLAVALYLLAAAVFHKPLPAIEP